MDTKYQLTGEQRQVLALAVQILEDLPRRFQPGSDMEDMRMLLRGESCGRDGYIYDEALALVLAFRVMTAPVSKAFDSDEGANNAVAGFNNRLHEFKKLLALIADRNPSTLALLLASACGLVKLALLAKTTDDDTGELTPPPGTGSF